MKYEWEYIRVSKRRDKTKIDQFFDRKARSPANYQKEYCGTTDRGTAEALTYHLSCHRIERLSNHLSEILH